MNGSKSEYKRSKTIGLGGLKCSCCAPQHATARKRAKRTRKRQGRHAWKREVRAEVSQ